MCVGLRCECGWCERMIGAGRWALVVCEAWGLSRRVSSWSVRLEYVCVAGLTRRLWWHTPVGFAEGGRGRRITSSRPAWATHFFLLGSSLFRPASHKHTHTTMPALLSFHPHSSSHPYAHTITSSFTPQLTTYSQHPHTHTAQQPPQHFLSTLSSTCLASRRLATHLLPCPTLPYPTLPYPNQSPHHPPFTTWPHLVAHRP